MSRLYKSLLEKDTNLAKVRTDIDKIEVGKYQIDEIDETIQYPEKHSPIYQYLENQLSRHVVAVLDDNNGQEFMPDLDLYFEPGFVRELLLTYELRMRFRIWWQFTLFLFVIRIALLCQ